MRRKTAAGRVNGNLLSNFARRPVRGGVVMLTIVSLILGPLPSLRTALACPFPPTTPAKVPDDTSCDECPPPANSGSGGGPQSVAESPGPVIYASGNVREVATDAYLPGVTFGWSHTRQYSSLLVDTSDNELPGIQGARWQTNLLTSYVREVGAGPNYDVEVYVDATHKRVFANSGGTYTAPDDYHATLTHDTTNHYYVLTDIGSGTVLKYRDFDNSWNEAQGALECRTDRYGVSMTYHFEGTEPGGRIDYIHTSQEWYIDFSYSSTPPNYGRLTQIDVKNASSQVVQRVKYIYHDDGSDFDDDVGSGGDLALVKVMRAASGDTLSTTPADSAFSIQRYTMYRYYRSGSGNGGTHQLKMVIEPDMVDRMMTDHSLTIGNLTGSGGILDKDDDTDTLSADPPGTALGNHVEDYASRTFTYYTDDFDTSANQTTIWGTEDLENKYCDGDAENNSLDETDWVKSETIYGRCGGCGPGAGAGGMRYDYYYMDLNDGASSDVNQVVRIVVVDTVDAADTPAFVRRKILGLNADRVELREIMATGAIATPQYWCRSIVLGADDGDGDDRKVTERRTPSAHDCINSLTEVQDFLAAYTSANWNNSNIYNDAAGLVRKYYYNSNGYIVNETVKQGRSGTEYVTSTTEYGDGETENEPAHLPQATYVYRGYVAYNPGTHESSGQKTEYDYTF